MAFRVLIIGGTGQVGAAVVRALVAEPSCAEVVMINRKAIPLTGNRRLRRVILDTGVAQFPAEVTKLALSMVALGDPVYGASCVGVGRGSRKWSEEELKALEIGVVGGFARGCHARGVAQFALLSAAGIAYSIYLVFYGTPSKVHHMAIYIGQGRIIHAPTFGQPVQIASLNLMADFVGASRPGWRSSGVVVGSQN